MSTQEFAAGDGTAIVEAIQPAETFAVLPLNLIVPSLTNPRKTFNLDKLLDLGESIKASGVHQPILVRKLPASRLEDTFRSRLEGNPLPEYEIVSGERRHRASVMAAGVETIPAMIRNLTDDEVLSIQIVENLQRDDLTELEEAEGYQRLCEATGISKEEVGERIGKKRTYVYNRMKLLDLASESREALRAGTIDASRALLIARIPDAKQQKKALTEATRPDWQGNPPSVRDFQKWLRDNVMLRLDQAIFDIKDESLHATAGACKACPKRTGAEPELFAEVQGADLCTDRTCFDAKGAVHRDRIIAKAEGKGMTVIEGKAAKEICAKYGPQLQGYSRLDQKRLDIEESGPTLRKLLGKDAPSPVLIEDPYTKELIEAVPTAEAEAMLVTKGLIDPTESKSAKTLDDKIENLKYAASQELPKIEREAMFAAVKDAVRTTRDDAVMSLLSAELARAWLLYQINDYDAGDTLAEVLNLTIEGDGYDAKQTAAFNSIQAASEANVIRAAVLFMASDEKSFYPYSKRHQETKALKAIAQATHLDLDKAAEAAKAARKLKLRNDIAELKAKSEPKPAKVKAPAEKKSTAPPTAQAKRAKKKSKEEAQLEISLALKKLDQAPAGARLEEVAADAAPSTGATAVDQVDAPESQIQAPGGAGREEEAAIAAAPVSAPVQTPAPAPATPAALLTGDPVTFRSGLKDEKGRTRKYSGKAGTVLSTWPDGLVEVRYGSRPGDTVSVPLDELEPPPTDGAVPVLKPVLDWPFPKAARP